MEVEEIYKQLCNTPSDIFEHLPILQRYASQCETIVECGVRACVSTWAFMDGLNKNNSIKKTLVGVDLNYHPNLEKVVSLSKKNNVNYSFLMGNDIKVDIPETDLLFIDTYHVYGHLKRELSNMHSKVKKWIIMHDTTVDEIIGESVRCGMNIEAMMRETGYSYEETVTGLWPAVEEFLSEHPEFELEKRYLNNNGLTVLKRKSS